MTISAPTAYDVLGVPSDADQKTLKQAYLKGMREGHPDTTADLDAPAREAAEARAKEFTNAYALVGTPTKRAAYDLQAGIEPAPTASAASSPTADAGPRFTSPAETRFTAATGPGFRMPTWVDARPSTTPDRSAAEVFLDAMAPTSGFATSSIGVTSWAPRTPHRNDASARQTVTVDDTLSQYVTSATDRFAAASWSADHNARAFARASSRGDTAQAALITNRVAEELSRPTFDFTHGTRPGLLEGVEAGAKPQLVQAMLAEHAARLADKGQLFVFGADQAITKAADDSRATLGVITQHMTKAEIAQSMKPIQLGRRAMAPAHQQSATQPAVGRTATFA